jgi:hypothetical protein
VFIKSQVSDTNIYSWSRRILLWALKQRPTDVAIDAQARCQKLGQMHDCHCLLFDSCTLAQNRFCLVLLASIAFGYFGYWLWLDLRDFTPCVGCYACDGHSYLATSRFIQNFDIRLPETQCIYRKIFRLNQSCHFT